MANCKQNLGQDLLALKLLLRQLPLKSGVLFVASLVMIYRLNASFALKNFLEDQGNQGQ